MRDLDLPYPAGPCLPLLTTNKGATMLAFYRFLDPFSLTNASILRVQDEMAYHSSFHKILVHCRRALQNKGFLGAFHCSLGSEG